MEHVKWSYMTGIVRAIYPGSGLCISMNIKEKQNPLRGIDENLKDVSI